MRDGPEAVSRIRPLLTAYFQIPLRCEGQQPRRIGTAIPVVHESRILHITDQNIQIHALLFNARLLMHFEKFQCQLLRFDRLAVNLRCQT